MGQHNRSVSQAVVQRIRLNVWLIAASALLLSGAIACALPQEESWLPAADVFPTAVPVYLDEGVGETAVTNDIIAQINNQPLHTTDWQHWQAADTAIMTLLAVPQSTVRERFDQFINSAIVWQQAQAAGVAIDPAEAAARLETFLQQQGTDRAALEAELAVQQLDWDSFVAYFGQLMAVDAYAREQRSLQNISAETWLQHLQTSAQISFGPAAQMLLTTASPVPVSLPLATAVSTPLPATTAVSQPQPPTPPAAQPATLTSVERGTSPGQLAPDFSLTGLDGGEETAVSLADLTGKPIILSFWTTWCPYCRAQTPTLVTSAAAYGDQVQFVGINVQEEAALVATYLKNESIPYPILFDSDRAVADRYQVTGFPTTYFLDSNGRVISRQIGQLSPEQLDPIIQSMLSPQMQP